MLLFLSDFSSEECSFNFFNVTSICAWHSAPPFPSLGLHLQPNEFRAALRYRIGVPLCIEERKWPYCQNGRLDIMGDHALSYHGRGGGMISRHDRVRDRNFAACSTANLVPVCQEKNLIPDNNSRPGDVYLPSWSAWQPIALDATITSPTAAQPNFRCSKEVWFCSDICWGKEIWTTCPDKCWNRYPVCTTCVWIYWGLLRFGPKNIETYSLACR